MGVVRTVAMLLVAGAVAAADDVIYTSGTVESDVKVLEQTADYVVWVGRNLKPTKMPANVIRSVLRKKSTIHLYDEKLAAARDGAAMGALAEWAKENRFAKPVVEELYRKTLELDPGHEAANLALGRVQHNGSWMTPAEREQRIKEEDEAAMAARGLVRWKEEWVTPEDREKLEQGLVRHEGKWMTPEQVKEAEGYVQYEGQWVRKEDLEIVRLLGVARKMTGTADELKLKQTEHYAVLGDLPENELQTIADTMEKLYGEWLRLFPSSRESKLLAGKHRLYVFKKAPPYQKLVRALFEQGKQNEGWSPQVLKTEESRMKLRLAETSFWELYPNLLSGHVQMPDPFEGLKAHCVHFGANILSTRYAHSSRFPTWWLLEGVAYYLELRVCGAIQTYNAGVGDASRYADAGPIETNKADPWQDASKWGPLLLNLAQTGQDPSLETIKGKVVWGDKNRLNAIELAKAWSVATYLIENDSKVFEAFLADAKTGSGGDPIEREAAAVIKHYGGYAKIDEGWKKYALNNFRILR